jgi:hypothetical protein
MIGTLGFVVSIFLLGMAAVKGLKADMGRSPLEFMVLSYSLGLTLLPYYVLIAGRIAGGVNSTLMPILLIISLGVWFYFARPSLSKLPLMWRPFNGEAAPFTSLVAYWALTGFYLTMYPIFPPMLFVNDYRNNLNMALDDRSLLYGWMISTPFGLTQLNPHLYMALGVHALDFTAIQNLRYAMLLAGAVAPALAYYASLRMFKDATAALASSLSYTLILPFWLTGLFTTGLYNQFYAGVLSLFFIWVFFEYLEGRMGATMPAIVLTSIILSHVSSLLLLSVATPFLLAHMVRKHGKGFWLVALAISTPLAALFLVIYGRTIYEFLLSVASPGGGYIYSPDLGARLLSFSPFLLVLANFVGVGTLLLLIGGLLAFLVRVAMKKARAADAFLALWFSVPWLLSSYGEGLHAASRYAIYALIPSSLLFGYSYRGLLRAISPAAKLLQNRPRLIVAVVALFFLALSLQGSLGYVTIDALANYRLEVSRQPAILESMLWLKENTPASSLVVSVGLKAYEFSSHITKRGFLVDDLGEPDYVAALISSRVDVDRAAVYVVLYKPLRFGDLLLKDSFSSDKRFSPVWENEYVAIFRFIAPRG